MKVFHVDFQKRVLMYTEEVTEQNQGLTNIQLNAITKRLDEINIIVDQCKSGKDDDVLQGLEKELEILINKIKISINAAV